MKNLLVFALALLIAVLPLQGQCARGFGTGSGVANTDRIQTSYATSATGQVSYAGWFLVNGIGGGGVGGGRVFAKGASTAALDRIAATNVLQLNVQFSSVSGQWTTTNTLVNGVWHSFVITYDASSTSNTPIFYLDGAVATINQTSAPSGTRTTSATPWSIGNSNDGVRNLDGRLAELAIWNGVILNASEALALSKGVSPFNIRNASLSLYLPLYGNTAGERDWSNAHATQTLTGTAFQNHAPVRPAIWGK